MAVNREDGLAESLRLAWEEIKGALGVQGKKVDVHNARAVSSFTNQPAPLPIADSLIDAFQRSTVGYARTVIRNQLLAAREILDQPTLAPHANREAVLKSFDAYENHMRFIATNQLLNLNAEINKGRQMHAGIRQFVWTTCLDDRVRPAHQQLEGQLCDWYALPSEGAPGEPYNCRCGAFPVIDDSYLLVRNQGLGVFPTRV